MENKRKIDEVMMENKKVKVAKATLVKDTIMSYITGHLPSYNPDYNLLENKPTNCTWIDDVFFYKDDLFYNNIKETIIHVSKLDEDRIENRYLIKLLKYYKGTLNTRCEIDHEEGLISGEGFKMVETLDEFV
jgi:hypothetical protein